MIKHEVNSHADLVSACSLFESYFDPKIPYQVKMEEVKRERNYGFHRKIFALIKFSYENTDLPEAEYKGETIKQSLETYRKIMIVRSGFFTPEVIRNGEVRFIPDSISYDKCSQSKAEKIYSALLDVISKDLSGMGYSRDALEKLSDEWLKFN